MLQRDQSYNGVGQFDAACCEAIYKICEKDCERCEEGECKQCKAEKYLLDGTCLSACPTGFTQRRTDGGDGVCVTCEGVSRRRRSISCEICPDGYINNPQQDYCQRLQDTCHINSLLKKDGHLVHVEEYKEELARNILRAEAEEKKKESYKELEEALKESEQAKRKAAKEEKMAADLATTEPIGFGGYVGILMLAALVLGVVTNFGQPAKKKTNLNRQKGPLERLWIKLK